MAKKVFMHKGHGDLEAPRNSLELLVGRSVYVGRDNILYAYHVVDESEKNCCSTEASMTKLINEDISERSTRKQNAPSVVARLMGVDTLPIDSKPALDKIQMKNRARAQKLQGKEKSRKCSVRRVPSASNTSQQLDFVPFEHDMERYSDSSRLMKLNKPKPREHPQEEELQKFKREFEAWQAARIKDCTKIVENSSVPCQLIAQEDLNREKMLLYANSKRIRNSERQVGPTDIAIITGLNEVFTSHDITNENGSFEAKESLYSNTRSRADTSASQLMNFYQTVNIVSAPSKIVVLRPGPERTTINEDSWNSSPSTSEERGTVEDFLEEVKERLESELQGKNSKRHAIVRGGGIETPYWEMQSEPRQIAQHIAQQVRNSVTRDFGMSLLNSEPTRSYRSDVQLNSTSSPEFISRDTRKFLTERLKNVLRGETQRDVLMTSRSSSRSSASDNARSRSTHSSDVLIENNIGCVNGATFKLEKQRKSFRREEMSPHNLIRSLSAPISVSGTSFGKLLLEDNHIMTGAQIRRKNEVIDKVPLNVKKKKDKFNIREKVSNFRYSLTLRGRLFRRRVQSMNGSHQSKNDFWKDINSGPTVVMSFNETNENFTEVPPSPASLCSSVPEELWRNADYLSPLSSCSIHQLEDNEVPHVFREITSNLTELRRKLNQLEGDSLEETIIDQQSCEMDADIEDQAEAYIRDLLVASGLYDGSYNRSISKWDPLGKPISNQVFEEVEESYRQSAQDEEGCKKYEGEKLTRKTLLDLTNEALPAVLRPLANMSKFMQRAIDPIHKPPQGRKLLFQVWEMVRVYVHPPLDKSYCSLDNMLARDLKSDPWFGLMEDDISALGRDFECQIIGDLIEESVKDML